MSLCMFTSHICIVILLKTQKLSELIFSFFFQNSSSFVKVQVYLEKILSNEYL